MTEKRSPRRARRGAEEGGGGGSDRSGKSELGSGKWEVGTGFKARSVQSVSQSVSLSLLVIRRLAVSLFR